MIVGSRILRYAPGADSTPIGVQRHDFWEEVYILEGTFEDISLGLCSLRSGMLFAARVKLVGGDSQYVHRALAGGVDRLVG